MKITLCTMRRNCVIAKVITYHTLLGEIIRAVSRYAKLCNHDFKVSFVTDVKQRVKDHQTSKTIFSNTNSFCLLRVLRLWKW